MTNKDIEDMKNRIDELAKTAKDRENENAVLKQQVKTQRKNIDSLIKELEEEKGKTITITESGIFMRVDKWKMINENRELKAENKELKHQVEYLNSIFEKLCEPESAESAMRKTGLFSEEKICEMMRANEKISQDFEKTVCGDGVDRDALIEDLQNQHQQDCIRINDLTATVHVLAGLYSTSRKNVGMD